MAVIGWRGVKVGVSIWPKALGRVRVKGWGGVVPLIFQIKLNLSYFLKSLC